MFIDPFYGIDVDTDKTRELGFSFDGWSSDMYGRSLVGGVGVLAAPRRPEVVLFACEERANVTNVRNSVWVIAQTELATRGHESHGLTDDGRWAIELRQRLADEGVHVLTPSIDVAFARDQGGREKIDRLVADVDRRALEGRMGMSMAEAAAHRRNG